VKHKDNMHTGNSPMGSAGHKKAGPNPYAKGKGLGDRPSHSASMVTANANMKKSGRGR
jgi:hypothetical protein